MYSVDTNVFIDWWERWYPQDIFPSVLTKFNTLVIDRQIFAANQVFDEIQRVGSPALKTWAKTNRRIFLPYDTEIQKEANQIQTNFPGLIDYDELYDEADRYVIAVAKNRGCAVVTHETSAQSKRNPRRTHYIPDVCAELSIECLTFVELMRKEKWSF